jgi:hypothetical protein
MRSPVTALIQQYNALTEVEQKVFLDLVEPQVEPLPAKRTRAKRGTGAKSKRASGMAEAIKNSLAAGQQAAAGDDSAIDSEETGPMCNICHHGEGYMDHSGPSPNFHKFEPPKSAARAGRKSKQNPVVIPSSDTGADGNGLAAQMES